MTETAPAADGAEPTPTASSAATARRLPWALAGTGVTLLTLLLLFFVSSRMYVYDEVAPLEPTPSEGKDPETKALEKESKAAERQLRALVPRSLYIVVDTSANKLYVKRGDKVLHEAVCSTGIGGLLTDPDTGRQWIFDTPRGRFEVIRKAEDPVWTKPDWAFVEEGKPVPEKWSERRDYDTLGDYALYFGDGYMIHGTLYQRYLGQSITHGCVRLGDEDLARVYRMTPLGTPILIF